MVWKICTKQLILKNHKILTKRVKTHKRGAQPKREQPQRESSQRESAHKHLFTETQAGNTGSIKS